MAGDCNTNRHKQCSGDSQCKFVPMFSDLLDVVLQVIEEQFHHVQLLLSPPDRRNKHMSQ